MPCHHKFYNYLNVQGLYSQPKTLIVGTFNPSWPAGNYADWFYGRTGNNYFWDVLPRLYDPNQNLIGENHIAWKEFCFDNRIALTDIIACINDANEQNENHQAILGNYQDRAIANNFHDFTYTDLEWVLEDNPTIQNVYLTRQPGIDLFDQRWALVVNGK